MLVGPNVVHYLNNAIAKADMQDFDTDIDIINFQLATLFLKVRQVNLLLAFVIFFDKNLGFMGYIQFAPYDNYQGYD